jgi:hypothetical protein
LVGAILANSGTTFNFSQSKTSYAFKNGYISIFDFKNCSKKNVEIMANAWTRILYTHKKTVLILLDYALLADKIISNKILLDQVNKNPSLIKDNYFIPHVEAWVPSVIPINCFSAVFLIDKENKKLIKIL